MSQYNAPNLCIYHANCADGFSAAWVVWKYMKQTEDKCDFHPGIYGKQIPDVKGKDIFVVDFSYSAEKMFELTKHNSVTVLDHHKTAIENLQSIKNLLHQGSVLDVGRCGAMITWNYFFSDVEPPPLLKHIQDRDLWKFKLPMTREINANVFSYEYKFELWDAMMQMGEQELQAFAKEGSAIERKHFKDIKELMAVVGRDVEILGHKVKAYNLPYTMGSDAGNIACQDGAIFAAYYYQRANNDLVFGLRSIGDFDVSKIAQNFDGGGHKNAAGFTVPVDSISFREFTSFNKLT